MQYEMFAIKRTRTNGAITYQCIYPDRNSLFGFSSKDIVSIRVTERPDIPIPDDCRADVYIGWKKTPDDRPSLIQQSLIVFGIQFPYGYQIEVEHGKGSLICLDIEEITQ